MCADSPFHIVFLLNKHTLLEKNLSFGQIHAKEKKVVVLCLCPESSGEKINHVKVFGISVLSKTRRLILSG